MATFLIGVLCLMMPACFVSAIVFRKMADPSSFAQIFASHYAERCPREECFFSSCGRTLCGYLYGGGKESAPGMIVVAAGAGCPAGGHLSEIVYFLKHGWQVFSFDATALGKSEGKSIRGLPQAARDLCAALKFLSGRTCLPLFLYAHSAGAYAAAIQLSHARVRAAACIGGFDLPLDVMRYHARRKAGILGDLGYPFYALHNRVLFGSEANRSALSAINDVTTPVLLCQDPNDPVVPYNISLAGKKKQLTNVNAYCFEIASGHSGEWLSMRAKAYLKQLEADYQKLLRQHHGVLAKEDKQHFLETIDDALATEPNADFLDRVLHFFQEAAQRK